MATVLDPSVGEVPVGAGPPQGGPLMTLNELAALQAAPRRPFGTQVSMYAKPIPELDRWYLKMIPGVRNWKEHMFLEYDDGRQQLIGRGGPSVEGDDFIPSVLERRNPVYGGVTPAGVSRDFGAHDRLVARTFLPGMSADQAAEPARQHGRGLASGGNSYDADSNSNSYAADIAEPIFGYRPGDARTPGYQNRLRENAPPPRRREIWPLGPLDPNTLTPIMRFPQY